MNKTEKPKIQISLHLCLFKNVRTEPRSLSLVNYLFQGINSDRPAQVYTDIYMHMDKN